MTDKGLGDIRLWKIEKEVWDSFKVFNFSDEDYQKAKQITIPDMKYLENSLDLTIEQLNITEDDYIVCEYATGGPKDFLFTTPTD